MALERLKGWVKAMQARHTPDFIIRRRLVNRFASAVNDAAHANELYPSGTSQQAELVSRVTSAYAHRLKTGAPSLTVSLRSARRDVWIDPLFSSNYQLSREAPKVVIWHEPLELDVEINLASISRGKLRLSLNGSRSSRDLFLSQLLPHLEDSARDVGFQRLVLENVSEKEAVGIEARGYVEGVVGNPVEMLIGGYELHLAEKKP